MYLLITLAALINEFICTFILQNHDGLDKYIRNFISLKRKNDSQKRFKNCQKVSIIQESSRPLRELLSSARNTLMGCLAEYQNFFPYDHEQNITVVRVYEWSSLKPQLSDLVATSDTTKLGFNILLPQRAGTT